MHICFLVTIVEATRIFASSFITFFPSWFLYSLPDALWTYSLTVFMIYNFNQKFDKNSAIWILIGPFISIISELFQLVNIVKGTFDSIDLLLCVIASILAFLHITNFEKLNLFNYENKYKIND